MQATGVGAQLNAQHNIIARRKIIVPAETKWIAMGFSIRLKDPRLKRPALRGNKSEWLLRALGLSGEALPALREDVAQMLQEAVLEDSGSSKKSLRYRVSNKLIKGMAWRTGAMGGVAASPAALPLVGTVGTAVIGATADFVYLTRKQIKLCYAISAVYDPGIDEDELQAITLALLGFCGTEQMLGKMAAGTLRNVVDATTARYLKQGIAEAAAEAATRISPRFLGRAYRLIPFAGIPLNASVAIASTMMVGRRAREYFRAAGHAGRNKAS